MKNKRVMLIYPAGTVYGDGLLNSNVPIGLLYLTAFLKSKNIEVKFLDALGSDSHRMVRVGKGRRFGMSPKKIVAEIVKFKPDIVGIGTMFTAYYDDSIQLADLIKSIDKKIMVVLGGSHVSINPELVAKNKSVDVVVFGEGEMTLWELSQGIEFSKIDGIVYKKNRKIIKNKPRELIKNLDDIPFPAWEELDITKYNFKTGFNMRSPIFSIVSSRGCPNHCVYCSVNFVWCHKWRGRSAKNVVDEMEMLMEKYGAREFAFQDDSVSVDRVRLEQICDEIIERKLNIKWTTPNGIAHWTLTKPLLKKMKQAGCYRITFGIESGDPELRRWIGKPFSLEQAKDLTQYANKLGFWTLATNIIGFPYETKEMMMRTFDFAVGSDVDLALFFRLGPREGTSVYEVFKKEGWLISDNHELFSENVACRTKYFTGEEIVEMQKSLYKNFLLKRWLNPLSIFRIINKVRSWEDFIYLINMSSTGFKLTLNLLTTKVGVTSKTLRV